ncbi:MAG: response regulator transcription factor [Chitinophagaceae bacterium]|nr:response regulator transcription factor [Rubrivivax sp.]
MNGSKSTVCVVDDDASVRTALLRTLRAHGFDALAFASAQEYLDSHDPGVPGCLVLDLVMPGVDGLGLQGELTRRGDPPPIVFLTGQAALGDGVQAMKKGAVDFLTKPVDTAALIEAIESAVSRDRADRVRREDARLLAARLATLTPREHQVLRCVVSGQLNKQTAAQLGTAEKTIKVHRARVMEKMQVASLAELVQLAGRAGIVCTTTVQTARLQQRA